MTHLYVHIYIPSLNSDQHRNERSKYRSIIEIISYLNPTTFLPVFSVRCEISDRLIVPGHSIKPARNECGNKALFHSFLSANLIMAVELYRFPISTTRRAIPLSLPRCFAQTAAQKKIATVNRGEKILGRYEKYLFVRETMGTDNSILFFFFNNFPLDTYDLPSPFFASILLQGGG